MTDMKGVPELTERELEKIINKYSRLLWSVSSKILNGIGDEQDVEECIADVFIDLWQEPDKFDPERGSLKSWLCLKCRSKSIDRFRKLASHTSDELDENLLSDIYEPGDEVIRRTDLKSIREAIANLEEPAKEIMIRRFIMEQKPAEISKAMELPIKKVENTIYRTKEKIRNELGDCNG